MKIYCGSALYRTLTLATHHCILDFWKTLNATPDVEMIWGSVEGDADVARARNIAASDFLKTDCDVLLTIDDDIVFSPRDALKLCREALDKDMVCGMYLTRGPTKRQPASLLKDGQTVEFWIDQPLVEIEFLATGFMAVSRRVFEKVAEGLPLCMQDTDYPFYPFYLQMVIPWPSSVNLYLSEDWAFCQRAKDAGFKLWLDPTIRLGHIGQFIWRIDEIDVQPGSPGPVKVEKHGNTTTWLKRPPIPQELIWTPEINRAERRRLARR